VPSVENDSREIPRSSKSEFVSVDEVEQRVCDMLGRYGIRVSWTRVMLADLWHSPISSGRDEDTQAGHWRLEEGG
jgi:hypothetical protein